LGAGAEQEEADRNRENTARRARACIGNSNCQTTRAVGDRSTFVLALA
jgi:hypothetical protein